MICFRRIWAEASTQLVADLALAGEDIARIVELVGTAD